VDTTTPQDPSAGRTTPVNTRIDAGREYPGKDSVRLVATDTSNASDDWIAVAAPRVPVTVPFTSLIGHDQPAALDWAMADRKARQSGVPDTTSAITQDMLDGPTVQV
jgi:hypothetical protein